jgi:hypothetical protein
VGWLEEGGELTRATAVMNYTEMESKVREATNNEPYVTTKLHIGIRR